MSFNEKLSYTEHVVTTPTTDFAIGFADYGLPSDTINVFVDDVLATEAGYTVTRKNNMVVELQPAVASGVVRLQRVTNLDTSFYRFTAGAKFVAANIDANFNQILHSQQEIRDQTAAFYERVDIQIEDFTNLVSAVQVEFQDVRDTANAAEATAEAANATSDTALQVASDIAGAAQQAVDASAEALDTANGMDAKVELALTNATSAVSTATAAETTANAAETTANAAETTANSIAGTASNAEGIANAALLVAQDALDQTALQPATETVLGGVKVGAGLAVTSDGILSNTGGMPLGVPLWHNGLRATIPVGHLPYDGQLLNRADYPAMWAKIQSTFALKTDAAWLADPKVRGCYSSGNGTTTFRMPDLNGTQSGSIKAPVLRGDGGGTVAGETKTVGQVDTDAIRNITGSVDAIRKHLGADPISTGALKGTMSAITGDANNGNAPTIKISMDASLVVPTAPENRMNSVYGVWICRVGDAATEISEPTLHAVLTGGNTFDGSQLINGALEVSGNVMVAGETYHKGIQYLTKSRWKSYKSSRVFGTTYLNNTPYEKEVNVKSDIGNSFLPSLKVTFTDLVTNESIVVYFGCSSNWSGGIYCAECFTVPPYTSYKAEVVRADNTTSIVTLNVLEWWERDYVA